MRKSVLIVLALLVGIAMAFGADSASSLFFTDSGAFRCGKIVFSESQHTVSPAYSWDREVSIVVSKDSVTVSWELNEKGGKVHKKGSKKITDEEYKKFCNTLISNDLIKLKGSELGLGGLGATSCKIEMHMNGIAGWIFEFTGFQVSKNIKLKNIKNVFLSFLPPR